MWGIKIRMSCSKGTSIIVTNRTLRFKGVIFQNKLRYVFKCMTKSVWDSHTLRQVWEQTDFVIILHWIYNFNTLSNVRTISWSQALLTYHHGVIPGTFRKNPKFMTKHRIFMGTLTSVWQNLCNLWRETDVHWIQ